MTRTPCDLMGHLNFRMTYCATLGEYGEEPAQDRFRAQWLHEGLFGHF